MSFRLASASYCMSEVASTRIYDPPVCTQGEMDNEFLRAISSGGALLNVILLLYGALPPTLVQSIVLSMAQTMPHIRSARFSPTLSCFGRFPKQHVPPLSAVPVTCCVRCVANIDDDGDDGRLPLLSPPATPRALPRPPRPPLAMCARGALLEGSRAP